MSQQNLIEGVESMSAAAFTRILGWSAEKAAVLVEGAKANLRDTGVHAYCLVVVAYGRKPLLGE
jgi:hypothetical protein